MSDRKNKSMLLSEIDKKFWEYAMQDVKSISSGQETRGTKALKVSPQIILQYVKQQQNPLSEKIREIILGSNADIDKSTRIKMDKGQYPVDATLDLHGRTQSEAFEILVNFIANGYKKEYRMLLVITGKGNNGSNPQGVLRSQLPVWINHDKIRRKILRINYAHVKHGGDGAFYILLRRKKK